MRVLLVTLPMVLAACSATNCERVNAAYSACVDELAANNEDTGFSTPDDLYTDCALYALPGIGIAGDAAGLGAVFACQAEAFEQGDCSTSEGFQAALDAAGGC